MATTPTYPRRGPIVVAEAARLAFGTAARLRGDRALHPHGVLLSGRFQSLRANTGAQLLDGPDELPALARISRGAGLPQPAPDILGCALRVPDVYGAGLHQDFALASSGRRPLLRHALLPARNAVAPFYSSILPYRVGEETVILGAELDGSIDDTLEVRLLAASPLGRWNQLAALQFDRIISDRDDPSVRFNPWNCGAGIRPTGFLNALRDPAYRASQERSPGT